MPWGLALGAGAGLIKNDMLDKPAADRKRRMQAAIAAYSPWTGMKAEPVDDPNLAANMLQYGATGADIASGIHQSEANAQLAKSMAGSFDRGGGLAGGPPIDGSLDYTSPTFGKLGEPESKTALSVADPASKDANGNFHSQVTQMTKSKDNPLFPGLKLGSSWWLKDSSGQ